MSGPNRKFPVKVDLRLTEAERDYLNQEAVNRGVSRQELLRALVLADSAKAPEVPAYKPVVLSPGREPIDRAIRAVTRTYDCIPPHKLEPIVATVICAIAADPNV
tara:strand:- start:77 stop:391 length:315 start_codon:yes stop_codon:yes gene_type:complete